MVGIYKITNPNGLIYIGQSTDIDSRKYQYSKMNCKDQLALYNSFLKYGFKSHQFEILEQCDKKDLTYREIFYIELFNSYKNGLNSARPYTLIKTKRTKNVFNNKISINHTLVWRHKKHNHYQFTKDGRCFNVQTGKELKECYNSRCLGFCIKGKFRSLKKLRNDLEMIPKKELFPF